MKRKHMGLFVAGLLVISVLGVGGFLALRTPSPIPDAMRKQVHFVLFVPTKPWTIEPTSVTYSASSQVLQFKAIQGSKQLIFTQQAAPSQFTDIPQFFPTLLDRLNQYQSFGTVNGTVYLTKPTELKGKTEIIVNHNGTLIFAYPSSNTSVDDWRQVFNNLDALKP